MSLVSLQLACLLVTSPSVRHTPAQVGHTLGLTHANTPTQEYGDGSCVMGTGSFGLYNAPHYLQLGWATPLASLNRDNFPADRWQLYILPPVGTAKACALVIYPDWPMVSGGRPVLYPYTFVVSYRWTAGGDASVSRHSADSSRRTCYGSRWLS